jgi:hypothetical protein
LIARKIHPQSLNSSPETNLTLGRFGLNGRKTPATQTDMKRSSLFAAALSLSIPMGLSLPSLHADDYTWLGTANNDYLNGANWDPAGPPILAIPNTAIINSGTVEYAPGGDLTIQNGGVLQINGGSFTQVVDGAWMQLHTGGTINVAGGTFNMGTAPRFNDLNGTFNISAGTATLTMLDVSSGGLVHATGGTTTATLVGLGAGATLQVSGGTFSPAVLAPLAGSTVTIDGGNLILASNYVASSGVNFSLTAGALTLSGTSEFKPVGGSTVTIAGGTLNAYVISFDGADTVLDFKGGAINLSGGSHFDGIYGGGAGKYVNFSLDSTGSFFIDNILEANFIGLFTGGSIRVDGVADVNQFTITPQGTGYKAQLTNPIPEPGTVALLGLAGMGYLILRRRHA